MNFAFGRDVSQVEIAYVSVNPRTKPPRLSFPREESVVGGVQSPPGGNSPQTLTMLGVADSPASESLAIFKKTPIHGNLRALTVMRDGPPTNDQPRGHVHATGPREPDASRDGRRDVHRGVLNPKLLKRASRASPSTSHVQRLLREVLVSHERGYGWAYVRIIVTHGPLPFHSSAGHQGRHGHEFFEWELSRGRLRYANNSNYRGDSLIRKESE